jgi:hypothetical protein
LNSTQNLTPNHFAKTNMTTNGKSKNYKVLF